MAEEAAVVTGTGIAVVPPEPVERLSVYDGVLDEPIGSGTTTVVPVPVIVADVTEIGAVP